MLKLAEPAMRQSAGALLASDDAGSAAGAAAGAGAGRRVYDDDNALGLDALLEEQERDVKQERDAAGYGEWGAKEEGEGGGDRPSQALDLASSPPPHQLQGAAHPLFGLDAHMQGDGAGGVEVGALYAEGDGALDWRQGDAAGEGGMSGAASALDASPAGKKKGKKRKAKDDSKKVVIKKGVSRTPHAAERLGARPASAASFGFSSVSCFCLSPPSVRSLPVSPDGRVQHRSGVDHLREQVFLRHEHGPTPGQGRARADHRTSTTRSAMPGHVSRLRVMALTSSLF